MILSFKPQFVEPILNGSKIHTIREDKGKRWTIGKKIHFATGVRTKNYNCFKEGECIGLQRIQIGGKTGDVFIGIKQLHIGEIAELAMKDGFKNLPEFYKWFDKDFIGIIIHWTDLLY